MDDAHPPLPPLPPVSLAGAARDAELRHSAALSREEVLRRRRRRLAQLCALYRAQYWVLADELPARHGQYWWEHGASPALDDDVPPPPRALLPPPPPPPQPKENGVSAAAPPENGAVVVAPLEENCAVASPPASAPAPGGRARCAAADCAAKAVPLSPYCFGHILLDPKQQLYLPCAFPTRKSGLPNGEATCGKPVLRGIAPLRCADHDPKSEKPIIEALRNAGIDLPLTTKSVPKLSLLISETVREIQMKRKLSMNGGKTAPTDLLLK